MGLLGGGGSTLLFVGYVIIFAGATLACLASLPRAHTIADPDTRRGLTALLATSATWAGTYVGFLLASTPLSKLGFYLLGLAAGLAAVGAWLYFCSAYTGRTLHRNPTLRRLALAVYLAIMLLKLTNPLHGLYYTAAMATTPFSHLAVEPGLLHWLAMALAYALSFVGYFMLLERFYHIDYDTRPLVALITLTALPALFDVVGVTTPILLNIPYEPLGVAAFAVGVLFVYLDAFQTIQLTGDQNAPVIYLDDDRHIREWNHPARDLCPDLADATGKPITDVLPDVARHLNADDPILPLDRDGTTQYYRVTTSPFTAGETRIGELVTFTDVTESEQYRRKLERTTKQLDSFASVVAHDLRNPLSVAQGHTELARDNHDSESLQEIQTALTRMETIIEDLLTLAREGEAIGDTEQVSLAELVETCWQAVEAPEATLVVDADIGIKADASRLQQLLENLLRNAIDHGGPTVTVRVGPLADRQGFYIEDDGAGVPEDAREEVFDPGVSTAADGTGFGLTIVTEIADAHDWEIIVTESSDGGARFEIITQ